jgi:ketosteroid isomerase-like protein
MSQENVELFRGAVDAWNRGDLEGYLETVHPDAEMYPGVTRVEGGVVRGHDGIEKWWHDVRDTFEELTVTFDDVRDLGDAVLGLGRARGRSKSGVPVETEYALVIHERDGLAGSARAFATHTEALEAAGLEE